MSTSEPGEEFASEPADASTRRVDSLTACFEETRRSIGKLIVERAHWNTEVSEDSIRHFAWGISDDNPLWVDSDYAAAGPQGRLAAPPTYLFSVLYPFLHGVAPSFPLTFLISDVDCRWFLPILVGDKLAAISVLKDVVEVPDRSGRKTVHIIAETTYRNQNDAVVGIIEGTVAAMVRSESDMILDREVTAYSNEDLEALGAALCAEERTGKQLKPILGVQPGDELPPIVRGPLTLGDLINWQVAIGPSYRAGALAYRDLLEKPHTATVLPRVGWPVRYSQQHEDFSLTRQRGMPAPFDNSAMRVAWISVLLTNWIGDRGFLRRLRISTVRPVIYGDTNWYTGRVLRTLQTGEELLLTIRLKGTNQLGEISTTGEAEVALPRTPSRSQKKKPISARKVKIEWGRRDPSSEPRTVCDLFSRQVQAKPESIALVCGKQILTYAALDSQADTLAHVLINRGVLPGSSLGLYLDRRPETAVAILACAKAGIGTVPLDPSYPMGQIGQIVDEAALDAVLIDDKAIETEGVKRPQQLKLKNLMAEKWVPASENFLTSSTLDAPAYELFTSGSTGRRKSVAVDHRSLGVYLCALMDALDVTAADVCLHGGLFFFFGFCSAVLATFVHRIQTGVIGRRDPS